MIEIGKVNKLIVARETKSGFYLKDPEGTDEVFLPAAMAPLRLEQNQNLDVFVYLDTQGRPIATDQIPYAQVGEMALMKVEDVQEFGAFFDWGIEKDLLVPGNEQKIKVRPYEEHIVRVCLEEGTNRVFGTTKLGRFLDGQKCDLVEKDRVQIVPAQKTDLGYRVIVDKKYLGMIYHSEIFSEIEIGETYPAIVKKIRKDGLLDLSLQKMGFGNLVQAKDIILERLQESGGELELCDKSDPELIRQLLGMSKKTFKNSIGMLYKERKITIHKNKITLN